MKKVNFNFKNLPDNNSKYDKKIFMMQLKILKIIVA